MEAHSPETPPEARLSEPWLWRACACCRHCSCQHTFLRTSPGPVSESPTLRPRAIQSSLTSVWFGNFAMFASTALSKTRFCHPDLASATVPSSMGLPTAPRPPAPPSPHPPLPPQTPTPKAGAKSQHSPPLCPGRKTAGSRGQG